MIKLSDYVIKFLADKEIKDIFMLPGGGCMHLVDSIGKNKKLNFIVNLHEQAVSVSAEAYSQYTNFIGVGLVTTGPGSTNAITGVASAWIDSIPLLILSGQVKREHLMQNKGVRQMGPQEVDIVSIVKPITKYAVTVMNKNKIKYHLTKAFFLAKQGRPGPVWIDIPLDIQGSEINENKLVGFIPQKEKKINYEKQIKKIINLLNKSSRPVILAGNGIRLSNAQKEFSTFINKSNIPVLTTWKGIDLLPENHPLYIGRPGSIAQRGANFIQQTSDLIITIGARLDYNQVAFNYKNFAPNAKKIIVDIDKNEINKIDTNIDVKFVGDAKTFLRLLLDKIDSINFKDYSNWVKYSKRMKSKYPIVLPEYKKQKNVNTYFFIEELSKVLKNTDVIVPGSSGSCSEITMQTFKVKNGQRILNSPGLGSMGFGLPASIGACFAGNKKRTISITGDGGLQHNIQELELLYRYNLPIKLFVLNNRGYDSIRNMQHNHFKDNLVACDTSSGLTIPELKRIAKAYKLKYFKINNNINLKNKILKIINTEGPVLCEIIIDPNVKTLPRASSEVKPDGSIVSKPMEDLYPFLDREEFNENMKIIYEN